MGLSRRQFTKEFKLAGVQRLEQGVSIGEAARALEVTPNVTRTLAGVAPPRPSALAGTIGGAANEPASGPNKPRRVRKSEVDLVLSTSATRRMVYLLESSVNWESVGRRANLHRRAAR